MESSDPVDAVGQLINVGDSVAFVHRSGDSVAIQRRVIAKIEHATHGPSYFPRTAWRVRLHALNPTPGRPLGPWIETRKVVRIYP